MKRRFMGRAGMLASLLILALIVISRREPQADPSEPLAAAPADTDGSWAVRPDAPPATQPRAVTSAPIENAPAPHPSLEGTDVNGGIRVDDKGRIILHRDVRRLFDYYLSLRGRMDNESIRALLRQHLEASQPGTVVQEALALFDQYVALINAEAKYAEEWTERDLKASEQVASVLEERRNLRREYLGDALSEAFYQDQEQYEAFQLERMKISTNPDLNEAEKKAALDAAESLLSPQQREIRKQTFAWLDIKQLARQPIESLDAEGADAIRQRFGDNALDRLAAVEQERQSWEQKREDWLAEKARLSARPDLSEGEKKAQLEAYGQSHLDPGELRRMQALDSDTGAH
ncbi:MAG TPA: lipase secretion chaperone [Oligoflexus sp.]|uniref:lipase secretion chaperone n=1 Tax=Oligoflexus sp. TaxID=1971216 RepID=UPI002D8032EE|nr:lipase secretion chaperone [Oligoflexus sp.]HET9240171.1 lipase secretion chaperone [Oligoflexus sp.]